MTSLAEFRVAVLIPCYNEAITIGGVVYTLQNTLTNVAGNVKVGANEAATIANIHHAINGSGGTIGTDYAAATVPNPYVTAALTRSARYPPAPGLRYPGWWAQPRTQGGNRCIAVAF